MELTFTERTDAWKAKSKEIAQKCLEDGTDVMEALKVHQQSKPKDVPDCILLDGERLMLKLPKFAEYWKEVDGKQVLKVHGGNFVLQLLDPRSKNKNGTPRYFLQGYYTAPAVAYLIDSFKNTGLLDAKAFKDAQAKVWNHLPFCKHHKDPSKADKDVKCMKDNGGYDKPELHWKVESK